MSLNLYHKSSFKSCSPIDYALYKSYTGDSKSGQKLINNRLQNIKILYHKDLYAHYGCVNAVEFSNDGEYLISGGDDKRVLLWNVNKTLSNNYKPKSMKGEHNSNIFCLCFDAQHDRIFSAGNDEQVILHDVPTGAISDVFLHDEAVYGLSVDPVNVNLFASACEDGRILIWDIRTSSTDAVTLANYSSGFHAVMYNPAEPRLLATANAKEGVGLWDIRKPKLCLMKYGRQFSSYTQGAMSVCFNKTGRAILALRRRLSPVLYEISSPQPAVEFDHPQYYNSCTMKSCCFAGDQDQFVLSGSDDFKLYMWRIPDDIITKKCQWINIAHLSLQGHRSIVNQVRYNSTFGVIASSGVEKVIKLWHNFPVTERMQSDFLKDNLRKVYTHEEYLNLVLESGQFMTHDYSHHSVKEDPRMMAFFDSLVQRDIEGFSSDSSERSAVIGDLNTNFEVIPSPSSSSSSSTSSSSSSSEENELPNSNNPKNFLKALKKSADSNDLTDEPLSKTDGNHLASDRISWLITKKKRQHQLHTLNLVKHTKHKKSSSKNNKMSKTTKLLRPVFTKTFTPDCTRRILNSVTKENVTINDKRKALQKKRARLFRMANISDCSSDSDTPKEVKNSQANLEIDISLDNNDESQNLKSTEKKDTTSTLSNSLTLSSDVNDCPDKNKSEKSSMPNSSTSEYNSCHSSSMSLETNGTIFFQSKNNKRHSRNYRKRSAEDLQDDC